MELSAVNLPQPKDLPRSTGSDYRIIPCSTCPPSKVTHQLERPAHIAYQSANLSFHDLLTSPSFNRFIKMHCFLKPDDYGTPILPENII
ncbi:hypothetical protein AMECASPLE_026371 [Ameca splendens]|uniref:Uncharacterized protein n=1 Tax=Ameca splendens TaxID=208324 RepID=A0ABV0XHW4_9TELE